MIVQKPVFLPKDELQPADSVKNPVSSSHIMSGRFPPLRFARNQVGAGSPTRSANNLQSQKPARPGYYGQSIGHDLKVRSPTV